LHAFSIELLLVDYIHTVGARHRRPKRSVGPRSGWRRLHPCGLRGWSWLLCACDRPRPRLHGCLRGQHAAASILGADNPGFQSHRRRPRSAEQHSALRNDRAFALGRTRGRPVASWGKPRRPKL